MNLLYRMIDFCFRRSIFWFLLAEDFGSLIRIFDDYRYLQVLMHFFFHLRQLQVSAFISNCAVVKLKAKDCLSFFQSDFPLFNFTLECLSGFDFVFLIGYFHRNSHVTKLPIIFGGNPISKMAAILCFSCELNTISKLHGRLTDLLEFEIRMDIIISMNLILFGDAPISKMAAILFSMELSNESHFHDILGI